MLAIPGVPSSALALDPTVLDGLTTANDIRLKNFRGALVNNGQNAPLRGYLANAGEVRVRGI